MLFVHIILYELKNINIFFFGNNTLQALFCIKLLFYTKKNKKFKKISAFYKKV